MVPLQTNNRMNLKPNFLEWLFKQGEGPTIKESQMENNLINWKQYRKMK